MDIEALYSRLPILFQNAACSYYGWREKKIRLGNEFFSRYHWLLETESWSKSEIEDYQSEQIISLINHAYTTVPHYQRVMDEMGLKPTDVKTRKELQKLPIISKEDIVNNFESLFSKHSDHRKIIERHTSGTTGKALKFASSPASIAFQWAIWWRHRFRFGVEPFEWHVNFTGKLVVPSHQIAPPYWRYNIPMRQVLINMHHITAANMPSISVFLDNHKYRYYSGYPSILHALATQFLEADIEITNQPDVVFLGAEPVSDNQKFDIEKAFGTKVTDQYGLSEGCANASRCEHGNYHEDWEFCVLECVDGESLDGGRVRGKIVATGFSNYAFPFLRYDTGDVGVWAPESYKCPCGRNSRVIFSIDGRDEDYVITPEGTKIMRFDYIFKHSNNIREAQIVQSKLGEIVVKIVPREGYSSHDRDEIAKNVKEWISPTLKVVFEEVDEIKRTSTGKFRAVISQLPVKTESM